MSFLAFLLPGQRHAINPNCRGIRAVFEGQVIGRDGRSEHVFQVSRDRHLADREGDLAVFDPEAGRARHVCLLLGAGASEPEGGDEDGPVTAAISW